MPRLTEIDDLIRPDHIRLSPDDRCYFLYEFVARGGYQAGQGNQLIFNLKKKNERRGKPDWRYKGLAIETLGKELREAISFEWLNGAAIVPMPPSKAKSDPEHDDRMVQVARIMCQGTGARVEDLLVQQASTEPYHLQESTRDVLALVANLHVDRTSTPPQRIGVLDDVLTTGAHFVAAKHVLSKAFPGVDVVGFFVARRAIVEEQIE